MKQLNNLAKAIHQNAKDKGFWDSPRNTGELFMLIISEASEALEAHRKGRLMNSGHISAIALWNHFDPQSFELQAKDTFEDELADVVIRILDYCAWKGIDVDLFDCHILVETSENVGEALYRITQLVCNFEGLAEFESAAILACFELAESMQIDLLTHIELKMKYNETRERLHGKSY